MSVAWSLSRARPHRFTQGYHHTWLRRQCRTHRNRFQSRHSSDAQRTHHNPLSEADVILSEGFYGRKTVVSEDDTVEKLSEKPTHYKVICISMYTKDLEQLDAKVAELKKRGWTKANKSQLIRIALSQVDIDKLVPQQQ